MLCNASTNAKSDTSLDFLYMVSENESDSRVRDVVSAAPFLPLAGAAVRFQPGPPIFPFLAALF